MSDNPDIILLNMPYSAVEHPSLALGLVHQYLTDYGYRVKTEYANLAFAQQLGLERYVAIDDSFHEDLLGEWTFAKAAFGPSALPIDDYFALVSGVTPEIRDDLYQIREDAVTFIDQMADDIVSRQPKMVGCTSTFQQNCASLALLKSG